MQIVLLRVGIDSGSGGIQGPLFKDGAFEFIPIPDKFRDRGVNSMTYGNTGARFGGKLVRYFPDSLKTKIRNQPIHNDPEFKTFTYGDPTPPKRGLRHLKNGDLLVFYSGLSPWPSGGREQLYIIGYFRVLTAGLATDFSHSLLSKHFAKNFHVQHKSVFRRQHSRLVLVKGEPGSRLLAKAHLISSLGRDKNGQPLKVLSPRMRRVFGDWDGHISIQRSSPRWVAPQYSRRAASFVTSLK
jgi:hypothetical protein